MALFSFTPVKWWAPGCGVNPRVDEISPFFFFALARAKGAWIGRVFHKGLYQSFLAQECFSKVSIFFSKVSIFFSKVSIFFSKCPNGKKKGEY